MRSQEPKHWCSLQACPKCKILGSTPHLPPNDWIRICIFIPSSWVCPQGVRNSSLTEMRKKGRMVTQDQLDAWGGTPTEDFGLGLIVSKSTWVAAQEPNLVTGPLGPRAPGWERCTIRHFRISASPLPLPGVVQHNQVHITSKWQNWDLKQEFCDPKGSVLWGDQIKWVLSLKELLILWKRGQVGPQISIWML